jgi:hypothetical protein
VGISISYAEAVLKFVWFSTTGLLEGVERDENNM